MKKQYDYIQNFEDFELLSTVFTLCKCEKRDLQENVFEYTLDLKWDAEAAKSGNGELCVRFMLPAVGLQYMWHPDSRARRVLDADWRLGINSMLTCSAPMAMLFSGDGKNTFTFASSEVKKQMSVEFGIRDEGGSAMISGCFTLPLVQYGSKDNAEFRIYADFRRVSCAEAADAVRAWWEQVIPVRPLSVPAAAHAPLYSSWYNFHKDIDANVLLKECRLAKNLGMDTIIIDDGWQTKENRGGYGYTGDWEVCKEKFPDMRAFVSAVHALDMKVMMWYAVPFMGYHAKNFARFENMLLRREDRNETGILDPRYPEVRAYIKETYVNALVRYDLDGLKLDFIDRFQRPDFAEQQPGMDFECVQEATEFMMNDIAAALKQLKPDIMIEFRQHYIGPCMRSFGNMFRVSDCPADITTNRVGIADLRLLSGETAVHSDMITWNDEDSAENAALQVLNTLFGVTQVSKVLSELKPEHLKMLAFWLNYERQNRDVLQLGCFTAYEPNYLYPVITASNEKEEITGVYQNDKIVSIDLTKQKTSVINACWQDRLTLRIQGGCIRRERIYNCIGELLSDKVVELKPGTIDFPVPRSGLLVLEKQEP